MADIPFENDRARTPSPRTDLGMKGIGEAATIDSAPVTVNAVLDPLRPLGVAHIDIPLTADRIWAAIRQPGSPRGDRAAYLSLIAACTLATRSGGITAMPWSLLACSAPFAITSATSCPSATKLQPGIRSPHRRTFISRTPSGSSRVHCPVRSRAGAVGARTRTLEDRDGHAPLRDPGGETSTVA